METKKSKSSLPLSQLFFEAAMNIASKSHDKQQVNLEKPKSSPPLSQLFFKAALNSKSKSRDKLQVNPAFDSIIDHPASQPNGQLLQDDRFSSAAQQPSQNCSSNDDSSSTSVSSSESQQVNSKSANIEHPASQPNGQLPQNEDRFSSAAHQSSQNCSGSDNSSSWTTISSSESCISSVSYIRQSHQLYPVSHEYYLILLEDATERYEEAWKFYYESRSYSFMFEFHIKILNDLFEELANIPPNVEDEHFQNGKTLRRRLRLLQLHLIGRRNLFLGYTSDQWKNENIRPPAGAEIYLKVAADAKAARERQYQIVFLVQIITDLKMKEDICKQRRVEAEAELIRYFEQLKLPSVQKNRKLESTDETTSVEEGTCQKGKGEGVESFSVDRVQRDDEKLMSLSTSHSRTLNDPCVSAEEEKGQNDDGAESFHISQVRREHFSPTSDNHNDSSNDRYCILWMESSETKKSATANHKMPSFIRLKPSSTCTFCDGLHWSHLCLKISTLEARQKYYRNHGLCPICGTSHNGACADIKRFCKWPQCRAMNSHHSALCPNVKYPITVEIVQAHERRINDLNRIFNRPRAEKW